MRGFADVPFDVVSAGSEEAWTGVDAPFATAAPRI
jgi:hypothetical protein